MKNQENLFGDVVCEKHLFKIVGRIGNSRKYLLRCTKKGCYCEKIKYIKNK